jgi:signal transduction histidine kinase
MLFEHAPHAYLVTDLAGVIRAANHAAAQLLAQNPRFVLSRPLASYIPREARRAFRIELNRLAALTTFAAPAELEVSMQPRGGDPVTARASVVRLIDPHTGSGTLLWMFHDVRHGPPEAESARADAIAELTRAKAALEAANQEVLARLEQEHELRLALERADNAKARFFAVLSHELRTPLQAIFGYTELLASEQSGPLTDVQREFLQRMERSQRHLLDIVNSILDFEKMVHGSPIEPELGPVPVGEVLAGLDALMRQLMDDRGITFDVQRPVPELVAVADRALVQQVLVNLLANAAKFTPRSGHVRLEARRASETRVAIAVRDTGRGIPADRLDQIFEPFVQIDTCDTQRGVGLGLAISRTIARRLHGELTVASTEGMGSEFTLTLPLAARDQRGAATT